MTHKYRVKREHWLLLLLLILNIVIRIPATPHGLDWGDSSFVWSLANSINDSGYMAWVLNPLSLFGIYAASYPSGYPVILSVVSQTTGIDTEYVIFICCLLLGAVGILASYIMALKFSKNQLFAFLTAFVFSTAPVFTEITRWTTTARGPFLALLPLFLWGGFSLNKIGTDYKKIIFLSTFVFITLLAMHRTSWLMALIIFAFIITVVIWQVRDNKWLKSLCEIMPENGIPALIGLFCVGAFLLQFSGILFYWNIWYIYEAYQADTIGTDTGVFGLLWCMTKSYLQQIGILLPVGAIGFFMLAKKLEKSMNDALIITIIIMLLAISAQGLYVPLILLPIAALLISFVLFGLIQSYWDVIRDIGLKFNFYVTKTNSTKILSLVLVVGMLISICFSGYIVQRRMCNTMENENEVWITDDIPSIGNFLKSNGEAAFLSNDGLLAQRVYASTGVPVFGRGYKDINGLINGWVDKDDIEVQMPSLGSLSISSSDIFRQVNTPPLKAEDDVRAYVANNRVLGNKDLGSKVYDNHKASVWLV